MVVRADFNKKIAKVADTQYKMPALETSRIYLVGDRCSVDALLHTYYNLSAFFSIFPRCLEKQKNGLEIRFEGVVCLPCVLHIYIEREKIMIVDQDGNIFCLKLCAGVCYLYFVYILLIVRYRSSTPKSIERLDKMLLHKRSLYVPGHGGT